MTLELVRHAASPHSPVRAIKAAAVRLPDGRASFVFSATGEIAAVRLPPPAAPARADDLWRSTCFEAFLRPPAGEAYFELNFSPSGEWAAYRLDSYRSGMAAADVSASTIEFASTAAAMGLVAGLSLAALPELAPRESWRIGLAAVIEADDGSVSHWALAHPPGEPDFHHRDCFAAELAPAASA